MRANYFFVRAARFEKKEFFFLFFLTCTLNARPIFEKIFFFVCALRSVARGFRTKIFFSWEQCALRALMIFFLCVARVGARCITKFFFSTSLRSRCALQVQRMRHDLFFFWPLRGSAQA